MRTRGCNRGSASAPGSHRQHFIHRGWLLDHGGLKSEESLWLSRRLSEWHVRQTTGSGNDHARSIHPGIDEKSEAVEVTYEASVRLGFHSR
jgi:hypothetical protein